MKKYTSSEAHSELHEAAALYIRVPGPGKKESSGSALTLHTVFADKINIIEAIKAGISYNLYESLSAYVPLAEADWVQVLGISSKTLQRYKAAGDHVFSPIHSEKLLRWLRSLIWVMRSLVLKINSGFGSMPRVLLSGLQVQRAPYFLLWQGNGVG